MDKIMRKMADKALELMRLQHYTPYDAVTDEKIGLDPMDLDHLMKICDPEDVAALVGYECLLFYNDFSKFPLTINPSDVNAYRYVAPTDAFAKRAFTGCSIFIDKDGTKTLAIRFNNDDVTKAEVIDFNYGKVIRHAITGLDKLPKYLTRVGLKGMYVANPFLFESDTCFSVTVQNMYRTDAYDHNNNTYHYINTIITENAYCDSYFHYNDAYSKDKYACNSYFLVSTSDKCETDTGIKVVSTDLALFNEMNNKRTIKKYLSRSYKCNSMNCPAEGYTDTDFLDNGGHYDEDKIEKSARDRIGQFTDRYTVLTEYFFKYAAENTMITTTPMLSIGSSDVKFIYEGLVKVINKHINMTKSRYNVDLHDHVFIIPTSFDSDVEGASTNSEKNFLLEKLAEEYEYNTPLELPRKIIIVGIG